MSQSTSKVPVPDVPEDWWKDPFKWLQGKGASIGRKGVFKKSTRVRVTHMIRGNPSLN